MLHALRYEPFGQRFEPQAQQHREREEQGRHIHLHLHVYIHLNLGARHARVRRFLQPTVTRVTTIFAAFMGALSLALSFFLMSNFGAFRFIGPHIDLADTIMLIGALLGSGAILLGGLPLVISAWRSTPQSRLLLSIPLLIFLGLFALIPPLGVMNVLLFFLAELLLLAALWRPTWRKRARSLLLSLFILTIPLAFLLPQLLTSLIMGPWFSGNTGTIILALLFYGIPLVCTIAIVRAIRQAKLSDRWLHFTTLPSLLIVVGMLLMIAGMLVWAGTVLFFLPSVFPQILGLLTLPFHSWLLQFIGLLIALLVIQWALFSRSYARTAARPKDASPAEVDSEHVSRGYWG